MAHLPDGGFGADAFWRSLPPRQRVANQLKGARAESWVEWTGYARDRRYVSLNNPEGLQVRFLILDRDHDDWSIPGGMPRPLLATITPTTGRHHLVWELAYPVSKSDFSRRAPLRLLAAVQRGLTFHLDADPAYTSSLTKNPLHPDWRLMPLGGRSVELREFDPWLLPPEPRRRRSWPEPRGYGRNVCLFDRVRFWAYDNWTGEEAAVHGVADRFNAEFADPLDHKEVGYVARSICKWMREKWQGRAAQPYDEGACYRAGLLDGTEDLRFKLAAGGRYGRQSVRSSNVARVRELAAADPAVSDEAVAADTGLALRTVQRIRNACDI